MGPPLARLHSAAELDLVSSAARGKGSAKAHVTGFEHKTFKLGLAAVIRQLLDVQAHACTGLATAGNDVTTELGLVGVACRAEGVVEVLVRSGDHEIIVELLLTWGRHTLVVLVVAQAGNDPSLSLRYILAEHVDINSARLLHCRLESNVRRLLLRGRESRGMYSEPTCVFWAKHFIRGEERTVADKKEFDEHKQ